MYQTFYVDVDKNQGILILSDRMIQIKYDQIRIRDSDPNLMFLNGNIIKYKWLNDNYRIFVPNSKDYNKIMTTYNTWFK